MISELNVYPYFSFHYFKSIRLPPSSYHRSTHHSPSCNTSLDRNTCCTGCCRCNHFSASFKHVPSPRSTTTRSSLRRRIARSVNTFSVALAFPFIPPSALALPPPSAASGATAEAPGDEEGEDVDDHGEDEERARGPPPPNAGSTEAEDARTIPGRSRC